MTTIYKCFKCTKGNDTEPCEIKIDYGTMEHLTLCVANGRIGDGDFREVVR